MRKGRGRVMRSTRTKEAEEAIVKKQAALERMTKDMAKLERDGLVEVRRMRVNLQVAEQELNEVKPLIPLLQKELAETKAAHERTQASTNETVNGLLEELRTTEDTLSGERKKQGHDLEQYRYVYIFSILFLSCLALSLLLSLLRVYLSVSLSPLPLSLSCYDPHSNLLSLPCPAL